MILCPTRTPPTSTRSASTARSSCTASSATRSPARATRRDPRYVAQKAQEHLFSTGIADSAYFGPEPEFFVFDDVRFETTPERVVVPGRLDRGLVEHRRRRGTEPRLQAAHQAGLLPGAADGPLPGPALGDDAQPPRGRHRDRAAPPRGGQRRPGRDRHPLRHAAGHGRQADDVQVRPQVDGVGGRQVAHVHAEAGLRGQRLGHAHPPVAVEGRRAALLRRDRLRRAVRPRPLVHRRPAAPRPRGHRVHQPDDQQLQAAGARLRGAGEPRVQPAQPLGVVPHPARLEEPAGEAGRVPLPRLDVEPVPRRSRRCSSPASTASRTASSRPSRWTRTSTTSRPRSSPTCPRCPPRSRRRSTRSRPTRTS